MRNQGRPTVKSEIIKKLREFQNVTMFNFHTKIQSMIPLNTLATDVYTEEEKRLFCEIDKILPPFAIKPGIFITQLATGCIQYSAISIKDMHERVKKYVYEECDNHELINDFTARAKELSEEIRLDILFIDKHYGSTGFASHCAKFMPYLKEFFADKKIFDKVFPVKEEHQIVLKGIQTALLIKEVGI